MKDIDDADDNDHRLRGCDGGPDDHDEQTGMHKIMCLNIGFSRALCPLVLVI
jgi:hypothetical protein